MTEVVAYIFSSGGIVVVLIVGGGWLMARPASRTARRFVVAAACFYALASTYGVTHSVGRLLAVGLHPFEASHAPLGPAVIVVLGSGSFTARDWDENSLSILDPIAATRVLEAVRVFKLVDAAWVISSGGLPDPDDPDEPTGLTMRRALAAAGVPEARLIVETMSRNTREEATIVAPILRSLDVAHTILVTSDTHMRRSLGAFGAVGVDAVPAIARHPTIARSWLDWLAPSEAGLYEGSNLAHETLGIAYYALRGWYR